MPRIALFSAIAAALLVLPIAAQAHSGSRASVRGTVAAKDISHRLVSLRSSTRSAVLRVGGSMGRIHRGQRAELAGSTLRIAGTEHRVLARPVSLVRLRLIVRNEVRAGDDDRAEDQNENEDENDELEVKGTITSLSPLTVSTPHGPVTCVVPAGVSLVGFAAHDFVEMTCDRIHGVFVLRKLESEDADAVANANDDDHGSSGPSRGGDDDHGSRGPGGGDDSGGSGGNSGRGGGDD